MRKKFDTILLALALFCISGAVMVYNVSTANGEIAVSLSELADYNKQAGGFLSTYSEQAIKASLSDETDDDVSVSAGAAADEGYQRAYELLDPIVTPSE